MTALTDNPLWPPQTILQAFWAPLWRKIRPLNSLCVLGVSETAFDRNLVITGSFNGLLDRLAKLDYWDAWEAERRITRAAKKQGVEATIRVYDVSLLTGLRAEDIEVFCWSLGFIKVVETGEDPLLLASDVFGLLKVFERFVDQGIVSPRG